MISSSVLIIATPHTKGYALQVLMNEFGVKITLKARNSEGSGSALLIVAMWGPDDFLEQLLDTLPVEELNYRRPNDKLARSALHFIADRTLADFWYPPFLSRQSKLADKFLKLVYYICVRVHAMQFHDMYICIYFHVCINIFICTDKYICIHINLYICIHVSKYICI